ncbi:MAG TPA: transketolase [Bacteroidales bacterium]|nr:transketolase [Bacteroidales bacterium]
MYSVDELKNIATQVRRDLLRMIHAVQSGHPGGSLGCADYLTCLYFSVMEHQPMPFSMDGKGEDIFFLSNGHLSAAWYSVLAHSGYFETAELATFRKVGTRLQGHPTTAEHTPGVRISSGSLGQGMSVAIGAALAKKQNSDDHLVYSLHGDGELQEGQIWEAAMFAASKKVDNLISVIDYNGKQIDGPVDQVCSLGDLKAKFLAFGWKVFEMNGNDISEVLGMMKIAKANTFKGVPVVILMKTEMGNGVDFMMGTHKWHGNPPNDEQLANALAQLPSTLGDY